MTSRDRFHLGFFIRSSLQLASCTDHGMEDQPRRHHISVSPDEGLGLWRLEVTCYCISWEGSVVFVLRYAFVLDWEVTFECVNSFCTHLLVQGQEALPLLQSEPKSLYTFWTRQENYLPGLQRRHCLHSQPDPRRKSTIDA